MLKKLFISVSLLIGLLPASHAQGYLTGDVRLSCEAILCFASSVSRPAECTPSITKFFSIHGITYADTLARRRAFLNLCPVGSYDPSMLTMINTLVSSGGRCDANSLNQDLRSREDKVYYDLEPIPVISNRVAGYCAAWYQHEYTEYKNTNTRPIYIGSPDWGGYWVEAQDYQSEKIKYDAWYADFRARYEEARRRYESGH